MNFFVWYFISCPRKLNLYIAFKTIKWTWISNYFDSTACVDLTRICTRSEWVWNKRKQSAWKSYTSLLRVKPHEGRTFSLHNKPPYAFLHFLLRTLVNVESTPLGSQTYKNSNKFSFCNAWVISLSKPNIEFRDLDLFPPHVKSIRARTEFDLTEKTITLL